MWLSALPAAAADAAAAACCLHAPPSPSPLPAPIPLRRFPRPSPVRTEILKAAGHNARQALQPLAKVTAPLLSALEPLTAPAVAVVAPRAAAAAAWANCQLSGLEPWQVVLLTTVAVLLLLRLLHAVRRAARTVQDKGAALLLPLLAPVPACCVCAPACLPSALLLLHTPAPPPPPTNRAGWRQLAAGAVLDLPLVRARVAREQAALAARIRADLKAKSDASGAPPGLRALPRAGAAPNDVKRQLVYKQKQDTKFADGDSRVSGARPGCRLLVAAGGCRLAGGMSWPSAEAGWRPAVARPPPTHWIPDLLCLCSCVHACRCTQARCT